MSEDKNNIRWVVQGAVSQMNNPVIGRGTMFEIQIHSKWAMGVMLAANQLGKEGKTVIEFISESCPHRNEEGRRLGLRYSEEEEE